MSLSPSLAFVIYQGGKQIGGVDPVIMEIMAKKLNFEPKYTKENVFGAADKDGNWSGVVGKVFENE